MQQSIHLHATIPESYAGMRLDQALHALFPEHSRMRLSQWIKNKQVTVNQQPAKPKDKVKGREVIEINASITVATTWQAQAIALSIVYEDEALLVVNKPPGLVAHPAVGNPDGTLVNALLHKEPNLANLPRAGLVHRLDKDTSGLLVVAKTLTSHTHLVQQLQQRTMGRTYLAIVNGVLVAGGTVTAAVGRHPRHRTKMAVTPNGKPAVTHYRIKQRFRAHSLLEVTLDTGRTHQIRVHLAHIHHPIVGDPVYSGRATIPPRCSTELITGLRNFQRQALHASQLRLHHPQTQQTIHFTAPIPEDMDYLLALLAES